MCVVGIAHGDTSLVIACHNEKFFSVVSFPTKWHAFSLCGYMWQKITTIIAILGALGALAIYARILSGKLEGVTAQLAQAKIEIQEARGQIEALRDLSRRSDKAHEVLIRRVESGVKSYAEKMQSLDDNACDWLDQRLPDVLRKAYECGNADRKASRDIVTTLQEPGGARDGD